MISLLLTARQDSKYLAKFVMTFLTHTKDFNNIELLILIPPEDTWNRELFEYCGDRIRVIPDNSGLGRGSSHIFYNELAKHAKGDWLWYVCDDHYLFDGYDKYISSYINDLNIDPNKVNVIAPMCSNSGRISHILSRKTYELIGFGNHGNVDSYLNEMLEHVEIYLGNGIRGNMPYVPPHSVMSDLGMDKELMVHKNRADFDPVAQVQLFKSDMMKEKIKADARKLYEVKKGDYV